MLAAIVFVGVSVASADEPITVCSYNLKNWLMMDRRWSGSTAPPGPLKPKPDKEKNAIVKTLVEINPDILGVCEIGSEDDLAELQKMLADAGLNLPNKEYAHGADPSRRLGFLTRFPISARDHQTDLHYKLGDMTMGFNRGILDVTVDVAPGFQLRCMGLHLKSQRDVVEADQAVMRRNEAHLVREHINTVLSTAPDTNLLIYGDFNDHPKSVALTEIGGDRSVPETRMTPVLLRDEHGEVWTHSYEWEDSYSRLDYFFVNANLHAHVLARDSHIHTDKDFYSASDHRPIVLKVSVATTSKKKSKAK